MHQFRSGWYVIYTRPHHEKSVQDHLTKINVNSFLPLTKKIHTWHDRKKIVNEPLFPSYIFIYLNSMADYYGGMDAAGTLYYVRNGKDIARISDSIIDNVKLVSDQGKDVEVSTNPFEPSQKLIISEGALTGLSCEVVEFKNKTKLLVRVELLQRSILISLPTEHLVRV